MQENRRNTQIKVSKNDLELIERVKKIYLRERPERTNSTAGEIVSYALRHVLDEKEVDDVIDLL